MYASLVVSLFLGCAPNLSESPIGPLAVDLFRSVDEDPAALPGLVAALDAELDDVDLTARKGKRLIDLPELTEADFAGTDAHADVDTSDQFRAGLSALSSFDIDDNLLAQLEVNQTCVNAKSVKCHERLPDEASDAAAFLAGDDDVYRAENTIRTQTAVLDYWLMAPGDFVWVDLDDGRRAVVGRTWIREPFENDSGGNVWEQRFGVDVYVEAPDDTGRTRRFYGTWVGPTVGFIVGGITQNVLRSGLESGFDRPEAWLEGDRTCDVDLTECLEDSPF